MIKYYSVLGKDGALDGLFQTNSPMEYMATTLQLKLNGYKGKVKEVTKKQYDRLLKTAKETFH
ncbi:hypothetical protein [Brevibacillus sp. NRS-1366]|uniref:hypothetical protein n=1 Tax=Brevibacillus sp. NRS-1366 TaxID=3233899 RepID=UPI003D238EBC